MAKIVLAVADLGIAMPLQEALEAGGHEVRWDGALAPGRDHGAEIVVLAAAPGTVERAAAWRDLESPPALLVAGSGAAGAAFADAAQARYADIAAGAGLLDVVALALRLRFSGRMSRAFALGALAVAATGDESRDALGIVRAHRKVDLEIVRDCLRHVVHHYVTATRLVDALREARALEIPEVGLAEAMDGAHTVQTLIRRGGLDGTAAGRLIWALVSAGAARLSPEPPDATTAPRRAVLEARRHLRARRARLERASHYDVLEVTPDARPGEIDHAARTLAVRYGPERLGGLDLGDLAGAAGPTWQQILLAHQVLLDPGERALYDHSISTRHAQLRAPWAFERRDSRSAEEAFRRGQSALVEGEVFKAVSAMAAACRASVDHPDYEASLSWARYRAELTRGKERAEVIGRERAEAEKALEGRRPWPRALVALALLSAADSDPDAARWHLQEALACDPELPAARQLLGRLG